MFSPAHGEVCYLTYRLCFPDGHEWIDQIPFVGNQEIFAEFIKNADGLTPKIKDSVLRTGRGEDKDTNGVWHRVQMEYTKRERQWGQLKKTKRIYT